MDTSAVGLLAQSVMAQLDNEEFPEDSFVRTVAVVVEVDGGGPDTEIRVACSDSRGWAAVAFLEEARVTLEDNRYAARDEG